MDLFPVILLISAITVSVVEDVRRQKIPNLVTFPTMVIALIYYGISSGLNGLFFSAGGLASGMGFFMILYVMGGMGAGDVKLMGASGAATVGGVGSVDDRLLRGRDYERFADGESQSRKAHAGWRRECR